MEALTCSTGFLCIHRSVLIVGVNRIWPGTLNNVPSGVSLKPTVDATSQHTSDYVSQSTETAPVAEQLSVEPTEPDAHNVTPHPSNDMGPSQPVYLLPHIFCCSSPELPVPETTSLCLLTPTILVAKQPQVTLQPGCKPFIALLGPDPGGGAVASDNDVGTVGIVDKDDFGLTGRLACTVVPQQAVTNPRPSSLVV